LVVEKALLPSCMATAFGLDSLVDAAGYRAYLDQLLKVVEEPTDRIEIMMLEQLAFAHLGAACLWSKAGTAKGSDAVALYHAAAARLQNEFRKTALALQAWRAAERPRRQRPAEPAGKSSPPPKGPDPHGRAVVDRAAGSVPPEQG
jgi:hypothetical protein